MSALRRLLVTSALPYANGPIHLGHLVEYIQTDIWVRFQRLRGHECRYLCADDTHGTAIMMRAQAEGTSEEAWIEAVSRQHQRDFSAFDISFDYYGSTHCEENRQLCAAIWQSLRDQGLVTGRDVSQLFDPEKGLFLADRYVQGTCPKCGADAQNGDACDHCGATYSPTDLLNPRSTLTGAIPETRVAKHWFVQIEQAHDFLNDWTQAGLHLQPGVSNYLKGHFLSEPLRDWDVSRPAPYFGFEIPDSPGDYWYVWFDAPIGYIAATQAWCDQQGLSLDTYWRSKDTEIHHFIGKDIVYFHALFWPVVLRAAGYQLPTRIQVHGMLTVNGEKMSKSKGDFVTASTFLEHLESSTLRYYYATKLSSRVEDLDFDVVDFVAKINGDLVGKVANLASRSARFVEDLGLSAHYPSDDEQLFSLAAAQAEAIASAYEACDYGKAMRLIMALADRANEYVDRQQPWALRKDPAQAKALQDVCTVVLNLFRQLVVYLTPVLPTLAAQVGELFGETLDAWSLSQSPVVGRRLAPFKHLARRVEAAQLEAVLNASTRAPLQPAKTAHGPTPQAATRSQQATAQQATALVNAAECTLEDFQKLDLRVAEIVDAEEVPEAKKLLKLTLNVGAAGTKTVFAGIKGAYTPEQLRGRLVVVLANLKPRAMKFGLSEGMVVAASDPAASDPQQRAKLFLLAPDSGAQPGFQIS